MFLLVERFPKMIKFENGKHYIAAAGSARIKFEVISRTAKTMKVQFSDNGNSYLFGAFNKSNWKPVTMRLSKRQLFAYTFDGGYEQFEIMVANVDVRGRKVRVEAQAVDMASEDLVVSSK